MYRKIFPVLFLSMTVFFACENMDKPQFQAVNNVELKSINIAKGFNVEMSGDVTFFNPNDVTVDVAELEADVYVNGNKITTVSQNLKTQMKASDEFTIPLTCNIPLESVFNDLKDGGFFKNLVKKKKIDLKLDGNLKATRGGVGMDVPFDYEETHELKILSSSSIFK